MTGSKDYHKSHDICHGILWAILAKKIITDGFGGVENSGNFH